MQFLIQAPASIAEAVVRHGHKTHDAPPENLFETARKNQWDIVTTEAATALAPFDRGEPFSRCIVYLQSADETAIDRLFERYPRLTPGRLYTVTASRVKVRQIAKRRGLRTEN